jgi:D-sedoheptulose 7-phosphate isomerase
VSNQKTLASLYPFLQPDSKDSGRLESELLKSVHLKSQDSTQVIQTFFDKQSDRVVAAARAISDVYQKEGRLFTMGNGVPPFRQSISHWIRR